jgi:threonine dehydrogenase-like Zn-dependent dehydrogenase
VGAQREARVPNDDPRAASQIAQLVGPRRFELASHHLGDPPPGQVLLRVLACGVCASERHAVEDVQAVDSYPMLLGHEPVGTIEAVGEGVDGFEVGMRVTGGIWPSFAERVIADHRYLVTVPDDLSNEEALGEPLGCVIEGRRRTKVVAGDRVAVVGAGYMGLLMLQVLLVTGAGEVVVIDPREDALSQGLAQGASDAVSPDEAASASLDDSFDVVIEASGTQAGLDLSTPLVRQHGVLSILGYHQGPPRSVNLEQWNWKAIDVVNAHVRRRDLLNESIRRGLQLVRLGRIDPGALVTHRFDLAHVGQAFESLSSKPSGFIKAIVSMT